MRSMIVAGFCMLLSFGAHAAKPSDVPMEEVKANGFAEQRAAIIAGFAPGERYSEIDDKQRAEVMGALDRMQTHLAPATSIDQLKPEIKVAVYNDQEIINTILTKAQAASREVCKRHRTVYSRMKTSECHTVAEWDRRREAGRELAERARGTASETGGM